MNILWVIKEVKVKGYYRKNGVWVGPHIRTLKVKPKTTKIKLTKTIYNNPDQLELPF
jgi:hypothetical protein|tara:strand:- start:563 stop:733 length:171 start_codon:yes stop_codon:yes gene_type:complete